MGGTDDTAILPSGKETVPGRPLQRDGGNGVDGGVAAGKYSQLKSGILGRIMPAVEARSHWSSWKVPALSLMGSAAGWAGCAPCTCE